MPPSLSSGMQKQRFRAAGAITCVFAALSSPATAAEQRVSLVGTAVFERVIPLPAHASALRPPAKSGVIHEETFFIAQPQWRLEAPFAVKAPGADYTLEPGTVFSAYSFEGEVRLCNARRARQGLFSTAGTRNICLRDTDGDRLADQMTFWWTAGNGATLGIQLVQLVAPPLLQKIEAGTGYAASDEPPGMLVTSRLRVRKSTEREAVVVLERAEARATDAATGAPFWNWLVKPAETVQIPLDEAGISTVVGGAAVQVGGPEAPAPLLVTTPLTPWFSISQDGRSVDVGGTSIQRGLRPTAGPPIQVWIPN